MLQIPLLTAGKYIGTNHSNFAMRKELVLFSHRIAINPPQQYPISPKNSESVEWNQLFYLTTKQLLTGYEAFKIITYISLAHSGRGAGE